MLRKLLLGLTAMALAGCWTLSETEFSRTEPTPASSESAKRTLYLSGFAAEFTEYEAVQCYRTVYVPGYHGRLHCAPGYYEIAPSVAYLPQRRSTDMFLTRAKDLFERAGYALAVGPSDLQVEVSFGGPFATQSDALTKLGWNLFTVFFCDYGTMRWTASLRLRDAKTGRLLFSRDYDQAYEAKTIGLLPIFCASSSDAISSFHMQTRCLEALTDRVVADVTAFLAQDRPNGATR